MPEPINPYESPTAAETASVKIRRMAPNKAIRRLALGLALLRLAVFVSLATIVGFYASYGLVILAHARTLGMRIYSSIGVFDGVCALIALIGGLCCLAVPSESKALGWIQASVILGIVTFLVRAAEHVPGVVAGAIYLRVALGLASTAAGLMFVLRLSTWLEREDLARRTLTLIKLFTLAVVLILSYFGITFLFHDDKQLAARILLLARMPVDIVYLVISIKYIQIFSALRAEIQASWGSIEVLPEPRHAD